MLFEVTLLFLVIFVIPLFVFLLMEMQKNLVQKTEMLRKLQEKESKTPTLPFEMIDRMVKESTKNLQKRTEEYKSEIEALQKKVKSLSEKSRKDDETIRKISDENDRLYATEHSLRKQLTSKNRSVPNSVSQLTFGDRFDQ